MRKLILLAVALLTAFTAANAWELVSTSGKTGYTHTCDSAAALNDTFFIGGKGGIDIGDADCARLIGQVYWNHRAMGSNDTLFMWLQTSNDFGNTWTIYDAAIADTAALELTADGSQTISSMCGSPFVVDSTRYGTKVRILCNFKATGDTFAASPSDSTQTLYWNLYSIPPFIRGSAYR